MELAWGNRQALGTELNMVTAKPTEQRLVLMLVLLSKLQSLGTGVRFQNNKYFSSCRLA